MFSLDVAQAGSGTFPTFVSVSLVDFLATLILIMVVIGVLWKYLSWKRLSPPKFFETAKRNLGTGSLISAFFSELVNRVFLQRNVINKDNFRRFTHLAMFWGFVGLSVTTALDYIFNRPGNYIPLFGGSLSAIRLLGNISGIVMVVGATAAIVRLIAIPKFRRARTFGDVWFTTLLFLSGITGFMAEYWGEQAYLANPNIAPAAAFSLSFSASPLIVVPYGVHLVAVALLLVTAPVSAFIHALAVPSMRYVDSLGTILTNRNINATETKKSEHRRFKETAMIDQIRKAYEEKESKE